MAGSDDINAVKCRHYARFAAHLDRLHFDAIYWVLFVVVIFMLFATSWRYGRSIDDVEGLERGSHEHKRKMNRCMLVCSIYALVSVVAVVMEVFALMALQFCDGEDLMALYWSTWTVMQIGSLIAIFGVLLAVFHTIRGRKHPPWALALGTPVLVVAGLGHIIQGALHKKVKSVRGRSSISRNRYFPGMSTSDTITAEDPDEQDTDLEYTYAARILGFTPDGATIVQLCESNSPSVPPAGVLFSPTTQARIISTNTDGTVILSVRDSSSEKRKKDCSTAPTTGKDGEKVSAIPVLSSPQLPVRSTTPRRSGVSVRVRTPPPVAGKGSSPARSDRVSDRVSASARALTGFGVNTDLLPSNTSGVGAGLPATAVRSDSPGSDGVLSPASPASRGALSV